MKPEQSDLTSIASSRALTKGLQRSLLMEIILQLCDSLEGKTLVWKWLFEFSNVFSPQHVIVYVRADESPEDLSPLPWPGPYVGQEMLLFEDA